MLAYVRVKLQLLIIMNGTRLNKIGKIAPSHQKCTPFHFGYHAGCQADMLEKLERHTHQNNSNL
jgi:hypothetical protein